MVIDIENKGNTRETLHKLKSKCMSFAKEKSPKTILISQNKAYEGY